MPAPLRDVTSQHANKLVQRARKFLPGIPDTPRAVVDDYFATGDGEAYLKATEQISPAVSTKRKAQEPPDLTDPDDFDVDDLAVDKSCNQVRGMIRRFLDSGEMKKGEFAKAIQVTPASLNNFLGQTGTMAGAGSFTYSNGWAFFKKRELAGIKAPKKAKATPTSAVAASSTTPAIDISTIHLPGEEEGKVEIYDSCDEIRKKINAHLAKSGVTQAAFCRDLAAQLPTGAKIQSKQLSDFRSKKGARQGNTSCVFYAAYVYFEKLRIAAGKPKSKHRKDMEAFWAPQGGFDIVHGGHQKYICAPGRGIYEDHLGRIISR